MSDPAAQLQSKEHRNLLDLIDSFRSHGVQDYIDLPQICVCGDQSAGKSSVLEAISGKRFPAKEGLCTRFATELVLRRDQDASIHASIIPGDDRTPAEKEALTKWKRKIEPTNLSLEDLIEQAKDAMKISNDIGFTNDTLHVEVSGPDQPHLTLVDLPGIFRSGNTEQSTESADLVQGIVKKYMHRKRSIILAVVCANYQYVLQEVTKMAKDADPKGLRTMGLITKPDKVDRGSDDEKKWLKTAKNEDVQLKLGWHVLKNRSYEETNYTSTERDESEEKFFSTGGWATLEPTQCGVKFLKIRLSTLLMNEILRQLPELIKDVENEIDKCSTRLKRLGSARKTPFEQRTYLFQLCQDFSGIMTAAVQGVYNQDFFGNPPMLAGIEKRRLRAVVQNRLEDFASEMRNCGESQTILDSDDDADGPDQISRDDYIDEVKEHIKHSKGGELPGLFNPMIIGELFAQQCRPWSHIVQKLVRYVVAAARSTTNAIVQYCAADEVVGKILKKLRTGIEELHKKLAETIRNLSNPNTMLHAITYNPALIKNVQESRQERRVRAFKRRIEIFHNKNDPDSMIYINPSRIVDLYREDLEEDMERYGSSTAVDYMQAYYKVALDRYIDDISVLAVEDCLISKLPSLLTYDMVMKLDDSELARLVGESDEAAEERVRLLQRQQVLESGLIELKHFQTPGFPALDVLLDDVSEITSDDETDDQEIPVEPEDSSTTSLAPEPDAEVVSFFSRKRLKPRQRRKAQGIATKEQNNTLSNGFVSEEYPED